MEVLLFVLGLFGIFQMMRVIHHFAFSTDFFGENVIHGEKFLIATVSVVFLLTILGLMLLLRDPRGKQDKIDRDD